MKTRWQNQQKKIQFLVNGNVSAAREQIEIDFRREYESLKQAASQERTRLNELHEIHLDNTLNVAKAEANKKLINAWNNLPLKVCRTRYCYITIDKMNQQFTYLSERQREGHLYLFYVSKYI